MTGIAPAARAASPSTVVVPRDFPTIQAAVDAAASGSTIVVRRGTYTEEVVVSGKDVHLKGEGAPVIKAPATLTPYATGRGDRPLTSIVRIARGAHVGMSGFTVTGPVPCGQVVSGIVALQAATLELSHSRVLDIHPDPTCSEDEASGRAVVIGLPRFAQVDGAAGSTASGRIDHVTIARYQVDGINLNGPDDAPSRATVADTVITGGGLRIPAEQFGIAVGHAVATLTGNTVSDSVCTFQGCGPDPLNEFQGGGIFVQNAPPGTKISGNHISHTDVGIYQYASPDCCRIKDNKLKDNRFFGIVIQDGDGETHHNTITGGQVGIGVVAGALNTTGTLHGDRISGTTDAPVREIQCCGFTATAVVKD
ncbi:right-handed parallel beta-helix repeat-containing protein [Streptomyces sp. ZAF1911]|uniref:right-handed parallel beta-helix repeat-containing protein n=1 Tax=Streptomyces sp. ZAF1911 TaxID=2944129 RepID=UPI00237B6A7D|nr:right-handed parallel beta-helix repeat-containing protein [Streptomyces sp. ZAF1911]MDD9381479.1 right-handed parallel beta-helix repeat-containing protein [Streptomyces sp. ZAF1911]